MLFSESREVDNAKQPRFQTRREGRVAHRFGGTSVLRCPGLSTRSRWPCCFRLCQERGERGFIHPAKALGPNPRTPRSANRRCPSRPERPSAHRQGRETAVRPCAARRRRRGAFSAQSWSAGSSSRAPNQLCPRCGGPRPRSKVSPGRGQPGAPTHWEAAVSRGSLSTTFLGGWGRGCSPKPAAPPGTPSLSPAFGCHIPGLSPSSLAIGAPSPRKLWRRPQKGPSAPPGDANAGGGCRGRAQAFLAGPGRAAPA